MRGGTDGEMRERGREAGKVMGGNEGGKETGEVEGLRGKFRVNFFIVSASGGQKPQVWANFDIFGAPVPTPFTDEGHIWSARADLRFTLTGQISSECVNCVGFRWPLTTILDKF